MRYGLRAPARWRNSPGYSHGEQLHTIAFTKGEVIRISTLCSENFERSLYFGASRVLQRPGDDLYERRSSNQSPISANCSSQSSTGYDNQTTKSNWAVHLTINSARQLHRIGQKNNHSVCPSNLYDNEGKVPLPGSHRWVERRRRNRLCFLIISASSRCLRCCFGSRQ